MDQHSIILDKYLQAAFLLIAYTDGSAMQENGILDDSKTQTGATITSMPSVI